MFKVLTDAVENAIDVVTGAFMAPVTGDLPSKRQVAKLIADGLTIYAVSEVTGTAVDVLEKILESDV